MLLMQTQERKSPKEEILIELGLSKNDSKIYTTLVRQGTDSITMISKRCGIHRANVYGSLERLKNRGLVSETVKEKKKVFRAAEPASLLNLIKEKELKLKSMLPQFALDYELSNKDNAVEVYQGVKAIRNLFRHYLELGESIYAFGVPKIAIPLIGEFFQNVIHKKRAKQKQWMYHLYNSDAKERISFLNKLPYTKAKYLGKEYNFPVATNVCGEEVSIILFSQTPLLIIIKNKEMANAYQKYFQILWEKAKE